MEFFTVNTSTAHNGVLQNHLYNWPVRRGILHLLRPRIRFIEVARTKSTDYEGAPSIMNNPTRTTTTTTTTTSPWKVTNPNMRAPPKLIT